MLKLTLFLICSFFIYIKGIDESLSIYSTLNDYQTIDKNQEFIIETTVESMAYFDSIDKISVIYISKDYQKGISQDDERITGKFYKIEPNVKYYVKNLLYFDLPSNFKRYLYPLDLSKEEIKIDDYSFNYLYLQKDKTYTLNFEKNSMKKMIALSRKTLNAKITINKDNEKIELNKNNIYYKLNDVFKGTLILEVKEDNAFIEFLSGMNDFDDYKLIEGTFLTNHEITSETSILIIEYTQKDIYLSLNSDLPFKISFAYGFSNEKLYIYDSISDIDSHKRSNINKMIINLTLHSVFRDITLMKNEIFSLVIKIQKSLEQKVYINYSQNSKFDYLLDEEIEESKCKDIIKNIKDLLDIYVFSDIAKNPPKINGENYHHEKIDLKKELGNIVTSDRKFYEFYQDIIRILGVVKDLHFSIFAFQTPNKNRIYQCPVLPFNFIIKEYNKDFRIFIEKNNYYKDINIDDNIRKFIDRHLNIPLKTINNIDPFDYIQNWSKYNSVKNPHAQFTNIIKTISGFYLTIYPLNFSEISLNDYEFEDNQLLRIPYLIKDSLYKNNIEFQNYFSNIIKSNEKNVDVPLIDKIDEKFLIFKGLKKELKSELQANIKWDQDITYIEGKAPNLKFIKCKIDKDKKVNVIYQNSFLFEFLYNSMGNMLKCVKSFYSNNYPIIIIESKNGGGYAVLSSIFLQILQPNIENKFYLSYKVTPISQAFFQNKDFRNIYDSVNCKEIKSFDYFINNNYIYTDTYGDTTINHKRTYPMDSVTYIIRLALNEFREELKKLPNFNSNYKKPTDIIIFTDSYSYSATSNFIKGFQNTGGAVTVGYFGNPKIKGTNLFDASQSPSRVEKNSLNATQMFLELKSLGFYIGGVTSAETYNFHQTNTKDQIPREYAFDPVDYRVDIYSEYSDSLYDKFIQEGLNIHKKLNIDNSCNSRNEKLLLHDNDCIVSGYDHAYGGYKCKADNTWDRSKCEPYYCDIGYYFDQIQKKCIENCKYGKSKSYFIYEDKIDKTFTIEKDTSYYFIFAKNITGGNRYFLKYTNQNGNLTLKPVTRNIEHINGNNNFDFDLQVKSQISDMNFANLVSSSSKYSFIKPQESMIFVENPNDFNLYLDNFVKSSTTEFKIAQYSSDMTLDDILSVNKKYFTKYSKSLSSLEKNELYLFYTKFNGLDPFNIFINPIYTEETIEISNYDYDFLYLDKDKKYILDFRNNLINRMIKLSRETLDSEIIIENKDNIKLNSDNLYYEIEENYKDKLVLYVSKENALIEFLFRQSNSEIAVLDFDKMQFQLKAKYNILAIPKDYSSKLIDIELSRNEKIANFTIYLGYSKVPYNYFSVDIEENIFSIYEKFDFTINEHYKGDINLMNDEYYCVMIENFNEDVFLNIKIRNSQIIVKKWHIALILGMLILL